ncbi:hypothetical protein BVC71_08285 [Marivivens niveibacter]|uniref:Hedgehog/Intein (Hint) domain-containing protein n=1 Tax=Marivivens niveibacter TaxID=1930667 RepID=A0A251X0X1_9RHOB|nr:Hint domain-containing protein [Marivivens niveibacter]OUD09813.1 hypothetical protein BVC71_08285 [Marivivens niveibacter]
MAWIGLRDRHGIGRFAPRGLDAPHNGPLQLKANSLFTRGTIVIECSIDPDHVRQNLFRYAASAPWHSSFRIAIDDDGTLHLMMSMGPSTVAYALPTSLATHKGAATIWYTWDSQNRTGMLAARSCAGDEFSTDLQGPMPLSVLDSDRMFTKSAHTRLGPTTQFCAMANTIEPVGLPASLSGDAIIETTSGPQKVKDIKPGTSIHTANGGRAQVLHVVEQSLPARGRFAPRVIRAPFYGATTNIGFGATQQIELAGSKIEYLFNQEHVLAEIGHLVDDSEIVVDTRNDVVTYFHLLLDQHDVISLSGVRAPTLNPAHFRANPEVIRAGILRDVPIELLPNSTSLDMPHLRNFEALLIPFR